MVYLHTQVTAIEYSTSCYTKQEKKKNAKKQKNTVSCLWKQAGRKEEKKAAYQVWNLFIFYLFTL